MFINPAISKQVADEHHRDLIADAQQQTLPRELSAGSGTAKHRQRLTNRLWHRVRPEVAARPIL